MFAELLTPAYLPFAIAFVVMVGIGLIEAMGLGLGHAGVEGDIGVEGEHGLLDWLGLGGELPLLIWLTALLGCFTLTGIAVQQAATALTGAPLAWPLAAGAALVGGGLLNGFASRGLARIMPRFESSVVSTEDFLRRRGTILEGTARRGAPARLKIVDAHGQAHVVLVEPHDAAEALPAGTRALIVRRDGALFYAVADAPTLLQPI